jgi:RNA polymerase sigma factor (sigma-70 family)
MMNKMARRVIYILLLTTTLCLLGHAGYGMPSPCRAGYWVAAEDLRGGDGLTLANGGKAEVVGIAEAANAIVDGAREPTYNLAVARTHTYYVGEHGVWVHNAGRWGCSTRERLEEYYKGNRKKRRYIAKSPNQLRAESLKGSGLLDAIQDRYPGDMEDVVHDLYLKVIEALNGMENTTERVNLPVVIGLQQIRLRRAMIDKFGKRPRHLTNQAGKTFQAIDDGLSPAEWWSETYLSHVHPAEHIDEALRALQARDREIIELYFFGEDGKGPLTQKQIGERLGMSQSLVDFHMKRSLDILRRNLRRMAREKGDL